MNFRQAPIFLEKKNQMTTVWSVRFTPCHSRVKGLEKKLKYQELGLEMPDLSEVLKEKEHMTTWEKSWDMRSESYLETPPLT